ncbi:MAG: beta-lactamase family protein [Planctomycetes bacterium]|nr:beta-lactamase family protein [Planctomycetota bacterium]MCP4614136.1 beta-lactamase family protein [Planctomycetota bacterium]
MPFVKLNGKSQLSMHFSWMRNYYLLIIVALVLSGCSRKDNPNEPAFNSLEEEINSLADKYVNVGAMVGIIDLQQNKSIYSFGRKSFDSPEPPDADTVFEIGSITKTFTAILAADMFSKGLIDNQIVGHYLPADKVKMPSRDGAHITFTHLLRHMSGMPNKPFVHTLGKTFYFLESKMPLPDGFDIVNAYGEYTTEYIYEYLTSYCTLEFKPGTRWEYSNTGYGLLGHTLGLIDGTSYESILQRNIFDVLGMDNSSLFLSEQQLTNVVCGHDRSKKKAPFWTAKDIFQGSGFIKSSVNDMFKYVEANMGLVESPLKDAMRRTHRRTPELYTGPYGYTGWAWYILELEDGQEIIWSGGATNGHRAFIAFNPSILTGTIILMNSQAEQFKFGCELMMAIDNY